MIRNVVVALLMLFPSTAWAIDKNTFVQKAEESGEFEIASGDLAKHKAQGSDVKKFAVQMVADHTAAGEKLKTVAAKAGVQPDQINKMNEKHAAAMERLQKASAAEFDAAYVDIQKDAHEEAVALFREYAASGDDESLRKLAKETLPMLESHLQHVKTITLSKM